MENAIEPFLVSNFDIVNDKDTETMDLSKKDQESSQICRVMY